MEFILRRWKAEDTSSIAIYANNKKIADNLVDAFPFPYTKEDAEEFIAAMLKIDESKTYAWAIEVEGKAAGSIAVYMGSDVYKKTAKVGYWLAEPFWGKGIMPRAIGQICKEVFEKYDVVRITAEPFDFNIGSRKALARAGFTLEAILKDSAYKNGKVIDSYLFALLKTEVMDG